MRWNISAKYSASVIAPPPKLLFKLFLELHIVLVVSAHSTISAVSPISPLISRIKVSGEHLYRCSYATSERIKAVSFYR